MTTSSPRRLCRSGEVARAARTDEHPPCKWEGSGSIPDTGSRHEPPGLSSPRTRLPRRRPRGLVAPSAPRAPRLAARGRPGATFPRPRDTRDALRRSLSTRRDHTRKLAGSTPANGSAASPQPSAVDAQRLGHSFFPNDHTSRLLHSGSVHNFRDSSARAGPTRKGNSWFDSSHRSQNLR